MMKTYTADICDEYTDDVKVLDPVFKSYGGVTMCKGPITTIELDEDNRDLIKVLRDEDGAGRICVVNVKGNTCAVVGDNLMGYAHKSGWAGIIINGYVRDVHETSNIPVGLFAKGTYPLRSKKRAEGKRDIPVQIGEVTLKTGDFVYADNDGIIVMEKECA